MLLAERCVCINLLERNDRFENAQAQFARLESSPYFDPAQVEFHRVQRHSQGGRYGCYDSHRSVIQKAYDDGLESLLIFEDDIFFHDGSLDILQDAHDFLVAAKQNQLELDALYLGSEIKFVDEKTTPKIWRVKCVHAHAYIVSRRGMQKYLAAHQQFVQELLHWPQDVTANSIWQNIYAHCHHRCIGQDPVYGTDLNWFPDIPDEYSNWFQNDLGVQYEKLMEPLIMSSWWHKSWLGRRYVFCVDHCVMDDGRIRLQGLWQVDLVIVFFLTLFFNKPPYGYIHFFKTFVLGITRYLKNRLIASKGKRFD